VATSVLAFNYHELLERIVALAARSSSMRPPSVPVTLIAVSKKQTLDAIEELYALGHRDFGENYAQELVGKAEELDKRGCHAIRWHFIGHLQTNKVKSLIPWVASVHTLNSERLAQELAGRWKVSGRAGKLPVFIEVNLDEEEAKSGVRSNEVADLSTRIAQFPELELVGLMCVPPVGCDPTVRFKALADLEKQLRPWSQGRLSMGMSADFALAIAEGATDVRVGTVLFGSRAVESASTL
jgi:pyridoxal phosphate enzyme (YggS family)